MQVNRNTLKERIKECRKASGLTQEELAVRLHVKRQIISYYESIDSERTPNIDILVSMADLFNTTTDYLLGLTETESKDVDVQNLCNYTGLNEESIVRLHSYASLPKHLNNRAMREQSLRTLSLINYVISSKSFKQAISDILYYLSTMKNEIDFFYDTIDRINKNEAYATEIVREATIYNDARLSYFEAVESFKKIVDDYTAETYKKWEKAKEKQKYISHSAFDFSESQTKKGYEISYDLTEVEKEELYPLIEKIKQEVNPYFEEIEGEINAHNNETE